jgi:site-specific recombinase XerD
LLSADNARRATVWVREHSTGTKGGEGAARALVTTLKTGSAWLTDDGVFVSDPLARLKRPKGTDSARTPFGQEEIRSLVVSAAGSRNGARDAAMIHLLLDTGMRVGGLCSIRVDDLNLRDRRLELRLKGGRRHALYFGSPDRRDGGKTIRALRAYLAERDGIARRWPDRHQGRLFLGFDGWPMRENGVRTMLVKLAHEANVSNVHPHRFRHTFASWYLVRHPGDETGLRGILGHLSDDMYRVYTHIAHEIIAQRAGRVSLSEAWLGNDEEAEGPPAHQLLRLKLSNAAAADTQDLLAAVEANPALVRVLLQALQGTRQ